MSNNAPREKRVPIMMSDAEVKAVDDWRYDNRVGTRSDAVRRLCQLGLAYSDQTRTIYGSTAVIAKAAGELAALKAGMWSGEKPIDLDQLGRLINRLVDASVDLSTGMLMVGKAHVQAARPDTDGDQP